MVGEQSEENISRLLQIIHVAISCTPPQHIGKSGVFAALRYHGVEVLLPKGEIIPEYKTAIESYQLELKDRNPEEWGVEIVSKKFIEILNQQ